MCFTLLQQEVSETPQLTGTATDTYLSLKGATANNKGELYALLNYNV